MVRKEAGELTETLENGLLFPGVELIALVYEGGLESDLRLHAADSGRLDDRSGPILAEAERIAEQVAKRQRRRKRSRVFYPAPESLYLRTRNSSERWRRSTRSRSDR